jgi:hypothetical protein
MAKNRIRITVQGDAKDKGDVRLNDFLKQLDSVRTALRKTQRLVTQGQENISVYYRIVEASKNSPLTMVLEGMTEKNTSEVPGEVVGRFLSSISQIKKKGTIPTDFDYDIAESYRGIASPQSSHLSSLKIANSRRAVTIDEQYEKKIAEAIGPDEFAEGSLTGTLDTVRLHNQKAFEIFPTIGPRRVVCRFKPKDKERVKQSLERYVRVFGRLRYKHWDKFPHAIDVDDIEIYPPENELPTLSQFRGIAPQLTGNMSDDEFLEKIRDGWEA